MESKLAVQRRASEEKGDMEARQQKAMAAERSARVAAEMELSMERRRSQKAREQVRRMAELTARHDTRKGDRELLEFACDAWKRFLSASKREEEVLMKRAERFQGGFRLRRGLRQWRSWSFAKRTSEHRSELWRERELGREEGRREHGEEEERMRQELNQMKERLSASERARKDLQATVRQAFMRGVCALNLEAIRFSDDKEGEHPPPPSLSPP